MEELLNIVTVGHVDHGKSTVIGRLLADAGALPDGKLEAIRENCRRNSKPFEYAFKITHTIFTSRFVIRIIHET